MVSVHVVRCPDSDFAVSIHACDPGLGRPQPRSTPNPGPSLACDRTVCMPRTYTTHWCDGYVWTERGLWKGVGRRSAPVGRLVLQPLYTQVPGTAAHSVYTESGHWAVWGVASTVSNATIPRLATTCLCPGIWYPLRTAFLVLGAAFPRSDAPTTPTASTYLSTRRYLG